MRHRNNEPWLWNFKLPADADGPARRCLIPINRRAVHRAGAECDQQATTVVDCWSHLPCQPSSPRCCQQQTGRLSLVYIALADGRRAVAKFTSPEFWTKFQTVVTSIMFRKYPNFFRTYCVTYVERNLYAKKLVTDTDRQTDRHTTTANARTSLAWRSLAGITACLYPYIQGQFFVPKDTAPQSTMLF